MKLAPLLLALTLTATVSAQTFTDPANLRGERVSPSNGHELPIDKSEADGGHGLSGGHARDQIRQTGQARVDEQVAPFAHQPSVIEYPYSSSWSHEFLVLGLQNRIVIQRRRSPLR